ncbi:DUF4249 domain-containing protein [Echinicola salinicaeni]|uniref:DUF4249 domain-containing protein n=1 Tax=Echinicola salinicaeni TaxID=2762757 RepID=UPI00164448A9|nr:DUF4249 domain-containing protein [Echinicola salinicaeni]
MNRIFFQFIKIDRLTILLGLWVSLVSCEKEIAWDLPEQSANLVVHADLYNDSIPKVRLTYSKSILDTSLHFKPVTDAEVILSNNDKTVILKYKEEEGIYFSNDIILEENERYQVRVNAEGYDPVFSEVVVPKMVPIAEVKFNEEGSSENNDPQEGVTIIFDDPAEEDNYYVILTRIIREYDYGNGNSGSQELFVYMEPKNPVYQKEYNSGAGIMFNDQLFAGETAKIDLKLSGSFLRGYDHNGGDAVNQEIYFILYSVSESYFRFYNTFGLQSYNNGDPFAQPVQVYTNVENGLGVVTGQSVFSYRFK